jgi:MSHA biogenesis protein MshQ
MNMRCTTKSGILFGMPGLSCRAFSRPLLAITPAAGGSHDGGYVLTQLRRIVFPVLALAFFCGSAAAAVTYRAAASATMASGSGGSIFLVGTGAKATAGSGNVTPTLPAGWTQNDLLLCLTESYDNVAPTVATAGWTRIYNRTAGSNHSASAFYKLAGAAEANPTVTHAGGSSIVAVCSAFRGVDTTTPFDVAYAAGAELCSELVYEGKLMVGA